MNDQHITAQVSDDQGNITNDVVVDLTTGESVATSAPSADVRELLDLFKGVSQMIELGETGT